MPYVLTKRTPIKRVTFGVKPALIHPEGPLSHIDNITIIVYESLWANFLIKSLPTGEKRESKETAWT